MFAQSIRLGQEFLARVLTVVVVQVKANDGYQQQDQDMEVFHPACPPFTRPRGPVHPRVVNSQASRAIMAITPRVVNSRKGTGWSSASRLLAISD